MSEEDEESLYTNSIKQQYMEAGLKDGIEQGAEEEIESVFITTAKKYVKKILILIQYPKLQVWT